MPPADSLRAQVARQVAHWRGATVGLQDFDNFASPAAWRSLERYLSVALRAHLSSAVDRLVREADALAADLRAADTVAELEQVRLRLVRFRRRFLQTETALDFYGDAVNSRTSPRLAALLGACDVLARRSLEDVLRPLGREVPSVLTYIDKGLGASILRAGLRLWDGGSLSPAAAVKITRHNLHRPTALIHETGHQAAHILGWNDELAAALRAELAPVSGDVAEAWEGWASEVAADTFAFAHTGYASVAALHDVVAGERAQVFLVRPGDPHPVAYLRVLLGVEMCVRFYGTGPWDDLGAAWVKAHPVEGAGAEARQVVAGSVPALGRIADVCLRRPMRSFGGRPLSALVDPVRVRPDALSDLRRSAGGSLFTSPFWLQKEGLRLLALSGFDAATRPQDAAGIAAEFESWMVRLGSGFREAA